MNESVMNDSKINSHSLKLPINKSDEIKLWSGKRLLLLLVYEVVDHFHFENSSEYLKFSK